MISINLYAIYHTRRNSPVVTEIDSHGSVTVLPSVGAHGDMGADSTLAFPSGILNDEIAAASTLLLLSGKVNGELAAESTLPFTPLRTRKEKARGGVSMNRVDWKAFHDFILDFSSKSSILIFYIFILVCLAVH